MKIDYHILIIFQTLLVSIIASIFGFNIGISKKRSKTWYLLVVVLLTLFILHINSLFYYNYKKYEKRIERINKK